MSTLGAIFTVLLRVPLSAKPNVVFLLVDDYGWANAGWHNNASTAGQREVQTPHLDALVAAGINLNQHYTFKFCSPTRSALQSGRNPIHVNVQNIGPDYHNPSDPISGFSAIARNITGVAAHMKAAGYVTAAVGKWDAGMATHDHTPAGRGYDESLIYFHHANDYWQYTAGGCHNGVPYHPPYSVHRTAADEARDESVPDDSTGNAGGCSTKFKIVANAGVCMKKEAVIFSGAIANQTACCDLCGQQPGCVGWTFHPAAAGSRPVCFTCNETFGRVVPGRTSGCVGPCDLLSASVTDLWRNNGPSSKPPPSCTAQEGSWNGSNPSVGPWPSDPKCVYEDALFEGEVFRIVNKYAGGSKPMFLFWAPHIVHGPAQLPKSAFDALDFITKDYGRNAAVRQNYLGRVHYIDSSVGRFVELLKAKGVWGNTIMAMSADNGGPLGSANNFPLRGGKHSNWQGGVRVNAFVTGGALPVAVRGTVSNALITAWDWYSTFVHGIAGADPTDHRAAAAGLPPIDSVDHWPYLSGKTKLSPRSTVPLGSCSTTGYGVDDFCQSEGKMQTVVNGMVAYISKTDGVPVSLATNEAGPPLVQDPSSLRLFKLLVGRVPLSTWTGPKYPNGTGAGQPTFDCGKPPNGGCLFDLVNDPTEHHDLSSDPAYATIKETLWTMIRNQNETTFTPDRGSVDPKACDQVTSNGGFWGPWLE